MRIKVLMVLFVALCLQLNERSAVAAPIILGGTELGTDSLGLFGGFMQGYPFVTNTDQSLTALGFWDEGSDGLPTQFQVGLWQTDTEELLASVIIDNSDAIDPSITVENGQWRYEFLSTPVSLHSGVSYTLAWQVGKDILFPPDVLLLSPITPLIVNPNATMTGESRFKFTDGAFEYPTEGLLPIAGLRANVNALLEPQSVPEPASVALVGLALAGLVGARRRRSVRGASVRFMRRRW